MLAPWFGRAYEDKWAEIGREAEKERRRASARMHMQKDRPGRGGRVEEPEEEGPGQDGDTQMEDVQDASEDEEDQDKDGSEDELVPDVEQSAADDAAGVMAQEDDPEYWRALIETEGWLTGTEPTNMAVDDVEYWRNVIQEEGWFTEVETESMVPDEVEYWRNVIEAEGWAAGMAMADTAMPDGSMNAQAGMDWSQDMRSEEWQEYHGWAAGEFAGG